MKAARLSFLLVALTATAYLVVFRAPSPSRAQTQSGGASGSCCTTQAPREVDFPYYNLTNGWISTLYLVSDSPQAMDFTLAVKSQLGQVLTTAETIQSKQKLAIDLAGLITQLGGDPTGAFAKGSLAVYYVGTIMPIVGQVTLTNPQLSLAYESVMVENDPGSSDIPAVLNGLWWGLGGGRTATVTVTNTSTSTQTAQVYLDFQGQRHALQSPLTFGSYETKVLDIAQLLAGLGVDPAQAPQGGITIVPAGAAPALIASGRITDPTSGFSATINFPAPDVELTSALHVTGVPIGTPSSDSPFAGAGTFTPHVVVRNLLASPQTVTVTLEYPQPASGSGPAPAPLDPVAAQDGTHSPAVVQFPLASVTVPPYTTQDVSFASVMSQLPAALPFAAVRIQYSGAPGSLQAEAPSVEAAGNLVVDSIVLNEGNGWAGSGANPWHLDSDTESVLFLTNASDQPAHIGFQVTAAGSAPYFLNKLLLNPHETRAIDIRKLRDAQKQDLKGGLIPAAATDGSVNWVRLDNIPVLGRMMQIHRQGGMTSSYDCGPCPCPANYDPSSNYINPSTLYQLVGTNGTMRLFAAFKNCNGCDIYYDYTTSASWTSGNTTIASIKGTGLIGAVSAGTTSICAAYTGNTYTFTGSYCYAHPLGPSSACGSFYGTVPAYAVFLEDGPYNCGCGNGKYRRYNAYDNAPNGGQLIQENLDSWTIHETGNPSCGMNLGGTDKDLMTFEDDICNCQAGCTAQINQGFSVVYKGNTYGLQAKDCPTCTVHNGWHLTVTTTSPYVTVTDN